MGLFDMYLSGSHELQLKSGAPHMRTFRIGDTVDIPDGVYIASGREGFVIILGGSFVGVAMQLYDTFGLVVATAEDVAMSDPEKHLLQRQRLAHFEQLLIEERTREEHEDFFRDFDGQSQE